MGGRAGCITSGNGTMRYMAAAIQFEPEFARPGRNIPRLLALATEAAQHGARLIVLPEMANIGYCFDSRDEIAPYVESVPGPFTACLERIAAQHGCVIVCGLGEIDPESELYYNTAVAVGPDGYIGKYRKTHFFSADAKWAVEGDLGFPVWDTPAGRLGIAVCMDATYPEVGRLLALQGAEVVCFPTNWIGSTTPDHRWISQAFENGVYWIAATRYGSERGLRFEGGSSVIAPDGEVTALAAPDTAIAYAEIDLARVGDRRFDPRRPERKLADRRPEMYRELVQAPYTWSPGFYHSLYGHPGLPEPRSSRVAVLQCERPTPGQPPNLERLLPPLPVEPLDLIVLPALLFTDSPPASISERDGLHAMAPFHELARERNALIAGSTVEREGARLYHTAVLVDAHTVLGSQRACHLSEEDVAWATAGDGPFACFDTPVGRIGVLTGYDACFFETLRVLASGGADLVCVAASIPWPVSRPIAASGRTWNYWQSKSWESCVALAIADYAAADEARASGIWIPNVREDRSGAAVAAPGRSATVVEDFDSHSRYIREKRAMGWRRTHWYRPLVVQQKPSSRPRETGLDRSRIAPHTSAV